jgi:hypothetical protein
MALLPLAPMSDKLSIDSIRDPHETQTSLAIPFLHETYHCLPILRHHTPDEIVKVIYTSRSLWK